MAAGSIPTYALYGELSDDPGPDWVHCETIQARSRLHNYRIEPHRHEKLFQILHLTRGQAQIEFDGRSSTLEAPSLVTLPPMVVHGYTFSPDVEGTVLTLFESRLIHILGGMDGVEGTFRSVQLVPLHEREGASQAIAADMAAVAAEFAGRAPGRLAAIEARLALILIALHRIQGSSLQTARGNSDRSLHHAMRFRQLVDQEFRSDKSIEAYACHLGLTATHLNRVCREHLGDTALGVIHQRLVLEAKRYLTFTSLSVKETALALGFEDPAYFTRFFKQKTGLSPLSFRAMQKNTIQ